MLGRQKVEIKISSYCLVLSPARQFRILGHNPNKDEVYSPAPNIRLLLLSNHFVPKAFPTDKSLPSRKRKATQLLTMASIPASEGLAPEPPLLPLPQLNRPPGAKSWLLESMEPG